MSTLSRDFSTRTTGREWKEGIGFVNSVLRGLNTHSEWSCSWIDRNWNILWIFKYFQNFKVFTRAKVANCLAEFCPCPLSNITHLCTKVSKLWCQSTGRERWSDKNLKPQCKRLRITGGASLVFSLNEINETQNTTSNSRQQKKHRLLLW